MDPPIPIREAVKQWEIKTNLKASEAVEIKLNGFQPPINKLDATLATFAKCEKLSLSTNLIDKLGHFQTLGNLRILSIGRNLLKSLNGIECLCENLEELWASYNLIEKLGPLSNFKKLKVLYLSNNRVKDLKEVANVVDSPLLQSLVLKGCPIQTSLEDENYKLSICQLLPQIKQLDGTFVGSSDDD